LIYDRDKQTSIKFVAHAASIAIRSVICDRSPDVSKVVPMAAKTFGDSTVRVSVPGLGE
jgi:hypothetical protein